MTDGVCTPPSYKSSAVDGIGAIHGESGQAFVDEECAVVDGTNNRSVGAVAIDSRADGAGVPAVLNHAQSLDMGAHDVAGKLL